MENMATGVTVEALCRDQRESEAKALAKNIREQKRRATELTVIIL